MKILVLMLDRLYGATMMILADMKSYSYNSYRIVKRALGLLT